MRLEANNVRGELLSTDSYRRANGDAAFRAVNGLKPVTLRTTTASRVEGDETVTSRGWNVAPSEPVR